MSENHPAGTAVRLTESTTDLSSERELRKGDEFEVEDFVSAQETEDGKAFYWLQRSDGSSVCVRDGVLEEIRTAKEQRARVLPDAKELLTLVSDAVIHGDGVYETTLDGASIAVYGRADNGLTYGFRLALTGIWKTDD